jgi:photosystem II stability/assembly factor-like uncharacterized protein
MTRIFNTVTTARWPMMFLMLLAAIPLRAQKYTWYPTVTADKAAMYMVVVDMRGRIYTGAPHGLWYSDDHGDTWSLASTEQRARRFEAIAFDGDSVLYTILSGSSYLRDSALGVYKSTDRGRTWSPKNAGLNAGILMAVHVDSRGYVYLTSNTKLCRSRDGGDHWEYLYSSGCSNMEVTRSGTIFINDTKVRALMRSTDDGATWTTVRPCPDPSWVTYITDIAATPNGAIFTNGHEGGMRSTDQGITWTSMGQTDVANGHIAVDSSGGIYMCGIDWTAYSSDGGATWSTSRTNAGTAFGIAADTSGRVYTASFGVTRSGDHGTTWEPVDNGMFVFDVRALLGARPGLDFAATDRDGVYRSPSASWWWEPANEGLQGLHVRALAMDSARTLYAGTLEGTIYRSNDSGTTWNRFDSGLAHAPVRGLASTRENLLLAATDSGLYGSNDGSMWEKIGAPGAPDSGATSIVVVDDGTILAGTHDGIVRSTDGGATWSMALASGAIVAIACGPNGLAYAVTDSTAYRSFDAGATWSPTTIGLPGSRLTSIAVNNNGNLTMVGTDGSGVYATRDRGATWEAWPWGKIPGSKRVLSTAFDRDGTAMAGTDGLGVFTTMITTGVERARTLDAASAGSMSIAPSLVRDDATITIRMENRGAVHLGIHDALGRLVATPFDGTLDEGIHDIHINAARLPAGRYFLSMNAGGNIATAALVVMR